jgi:hypothetical protein
MRPDMTELHEHYARQVDHAVTTDRMTLVAELNEEFFEEALRLILATA